MSRPAQPLSHAAAAAFDFDVVTDAPPRRPRAPEPRPDPAREAATSEAAAARRESAEA